MAGQSWLARVHIEFRLPRVGQVMLKLECWLAKAGQLMPKLDAKAGQLRPNMEFRLAKHARIGVLDSQCWPAQARGWPAETKIGVLVGQGWPAQCRI